MDRSPGPAAPSPGTGDPTSATEPVSAHAATSGRSRGSSGATGGASSSYPVSDSSGKTTTRAPAARIAAAWASALAATSYGWHAGCATATVRGERPLPDTVSGGPVGVGDEGIRDLALQVAVRRDEGAQGAGGRR